jgi:multicomponent Na+:H+ antiporter subunit D
VGAASISAFPLFSGFVSKSMVMVAALDQGYDWAWLILLFAAAGVFHHAGIKIPYFAFFAHDSGLRAKDPPGNMLLAMSIAAAICIFNGSYPWLLYSLLPWPVDYAPYTWSHVITQTQLLFFSALAFIFLQLRGLYPPELPSTNIDAEYLYRRLAPSATRRIHTLGTQAYQAFQQLGQRWVEGVIDRIQLYYRPGGILNWNWLTGTTALTVAILLVAYLLLYYA